MSVSTSHGPGDPVALADGGQPPGRLRTQHLLLMIVAAAAPLGVAIGNLPTGLILGNGVGLPSAFLAAGLVIVCLVTGFMRLAREVRADGGFADLVLAGLGPGVGLGAAYVTGIAYWTGSLALGASTGYFGNLIGSMYGIDLPWWVYSLSAFVLVVLLGRRAADLSANVLIALMLAEIAVVVVMDVAILANHGLDALPLDVFSFDQALSGNLGPAVMVGFTSFIGVESAILYTREARDPARSVPRATYAAVLAIAVLYVMTAWLVIGALGTGTAVETAGQQQGELVFGIAFGEVGGLFALITQLSFVTSLLACFVALHNASARYAQTLGARGALPRFMAVAHPRFLSPANASTVLGTLGFVLFVVFAIAQADPYIGLATSLTGLFTLGVVAAQMLVSIAVVAFFLRRGARPTWSTLVAPALGAAGAFLACVAVVANYSVLTGSESVGGRLLPLVLLMVLAGGYGFDTWKNARTRRDDPELAAPALGGES